MTRVPLLVVVFWTLAAPGAARAQSIPLTAKVRSTGQIIANGKIVATHVKESLFYRTSDGSELRRPLTDDGKPSTGKRARASLFDKVHGINYVIDYETGEAFELVTPGNPNPPSSEGAAAPNKTGESSVEGHPCTWIPVNLVRPSGTTRVGSNCVSKEYDLVLKTDITIPSANQPGKSAHQVTQLYDIRMGVEPDPKLFDLSFFKITPALKR